MVLFLLSTICVTSCETGESIVSSYNANTWHKADNMKGNVKIPCAITLYIANLLK